MDEVRGNGKDNVTVLPTIVMDPSADEVPSPCVREGDAYYEDSVFCVATWGKFNKM